MNEFIEKLKESFGDELKNARLSEVNVFIKQNMLEIVLLCPEEDEKALFEIKEKIALEAAKILNISFKIKIKIKKSYFDEAYFTYSLIGFLDKYPLVRHNIKSGDFEFSQEGAEINVTLKLPIAVADYAESRNIIIEINNYIYNNFCEKINFSIEKVELENEEIDYDEEEKKLVYDYEGGRKIKVSNVESFIGDAIYERPGYIIDAHIGDGVVLTGKIKDFTEIKRVMKEGETEQKYLFKFKLEDFTGSIDCVYFPTKKSLDKMRLLHEGKEIVAFGTIETNTFKGVTSTVYRVRYISLCTLPDNFVINRARLQVPKAYKTVFPSPYCNYEQDNIFNENHTCEYLLNKEFVVYDLETTGLNQVTDKILEIGAVKIKDGTIVECFASLIDPQSLIPEKVSAINGITNADVKGKPTIEEVMPDFFKFCDGAIMVGQNSIMFDFPFIKAKAEPMNIYFENQQLDLMVIAKRLFPEFNKYNLGFLAKKFGIVNEEAHRALSDAVTTAKIFIKLAEKL